MNQHPKGVPATDRLLDALRRAEKGQADLDDVAAICADAALRAGPIPGMLDAMTTSTEHNVLQSRLDDLLRSPDGLPIYLAVDEIPEGQIPLMDAAAAYHIPEPTARGWGRRSVIKTLGWLKGPGRPARVVSKEEFKEKSEKGRNPGGRGKRT